MAGGREEVPRCETAFTNNLEPLCVHIFSVRGMAGIGMVAVLLF